MFFITYKNNVLNRLYKNRSTLSINYGWSLYTRGYYSLVNAMKTDNLLHTMQGDCLGNQYDGPDIHITIIDTLKSAKNQIWLNHVRREWLGFIEIFSTRKLCLSRFARNIHIMLRQHTPNLLIGVHDILIVDC